MHMPQPEPHVPRVLRAGAAIGAGALASLVASVPAALRVASAPEAHLGLAGTWLALAASSLVPCVVAVALFGGARRGLASFGGDGATRRALGFCAWLFASVDAMIALGAILRATTHHHALAGATFALVALGAIVLLAAIARRLVAASAGWLESTAHAVLGVIAATFAVVPLVAVLKIGRSSPGAGILVDALAYLIAVGFLSRPSLARRRILGIVGPPLAVLVLALGLSRLRGAPLDGAVHARAPFLSPSVDTLYLAVGRRPGPPDTGRSH
jgi:hypothetical protein